MKLVAALCALVGAIQLIGSGNAFGFVWLVAAIVLFALDRHLGD